MTRITRRNTGGAACSPDPRKEIQRKNATPQAGEQIIVSTASGVPVSVTQPGSSGFRNGKRVYIEGSGDGARVVAQ